MFKPTLLTKDEYAIVCFVELVLFIPPCIVLIQRFLKCKNHESWNKNQKLRYMWCLQLILMTSFPVNSIILTMGALLKEGNIFELLSNIYFVVGQVWFYLFASIQLLLCLIVAKTVLKSRRKPYEHLDSYRFIFVIPGVMYLFNFPMLTYNSTNDNKTCDREYELSQIGNIGGLVCSLITLCCSGWLFMEFRKLIEEINKNQYTKESNVKNIRSWKLFLGLNITMSVLIFVYSLIQNIDEFFRFNMLYIYTGGFAPLKQYGRMRLIQFALKMALSMVIIFFSPFSKLKVKKSRGKSFNDKDNRNKV